MELKSENLDTVKKDLKRVIESEKIGILGAGEGSTPHLVAFLNMLDVDLNELLKECKGTIKQGISFENWNGDGEKYFHPFAVQNEYKTERCVLDIYYPKNTDDFTTVIWFHGGGIKAGNKYIPEKLKEKGIAVIEKRDILMPTPRLPRKAKTVRNTI